MGVIEILPLGAGQDVGRSCIVISLHNRNIMFDCGMHMGFTDERRFPDFSLLIPPTPSSLKQKGFTETIDLLLVTHFHLDHCGALPYFAEQCGYSGPIVMTEPTKAICPILLEDFRKIATEKRGDNSFFTSKMIESSIQKVTTIEVGQSLFFCNGEIEVRAYYAGHVLGAAMFWVRVGAETIVYTGDFNMTADRHLGAAWIDRCNPDILITESTYATTIRESKRARERDFLKAIHQAVEKGGKVLIPTFALGRVQELCILIDSFWDRMDIKAPIYFSGGMAESANEYYRLYHSWMNERIKEESKRGKRNAFNFRNIQPFERHFGDVPGAMVLFSTPGMLHAGMSLEMFKKWCEDEKNLLIIPGFCVAGTVGAKVLAGQKRIEIDKKTTVNCNMQVANLSFSAHADAKGIMQLIKNCQPKNVVLVHGEAGKMSSLRTVVMEEFKIPCYHPANGELLEITVPNRVACLLPLHSIVDSKKMELFEAAKLVFESDLPNQLKEKYLIQSLKAQVDRRVGLKVNIIMAGNVETNGIHIEDDITTISNQTIKDKDCNQSRKKLKNDNDEEKGEVNEGNFDQKDQSINRPLEVYTRIDLLDPKLVDQMIFKMEKVVDMEMFLYKIRNRLFELVHPEIPVHFNHYENGNECNNDKDEKGENQEKEKCPFPIITVKSMIIKPINDGNLQIEWNKIDEPLVKRLLADILE